MIFSKPSLRLVRVLIVHERGEHTETQANGARATRVKSPAAVVAVLFSLGALRTPGGPKKGLIGNSSFNRKTNGKI